MSKKKFALLMCLILLSVSLFSIPVNSSIAGTIYKRLADVQSIDNVQQGSVTKAVYGAPVIPKQLSDTVPPSVSTTDPANGTKGISADKTVTVSFSEAVTAGSSYNNIAIKDASGKSVNMTKSINGNALVLNPVNNLKNGVIYKVTIPAKAVKDLTNNSLKASYSFSFTTQISNPIPPDTVPPSISTTDPANGTKGISADKTVTVSFSEAVTAGIRYNNIAIKDASGKSVNMTKSINGNTLVLNPVNNLNSGVTYKVTIPAKAVKDLSNNSLNAAYSFSFTTNTVDTTWMEFLNGSDDFWYKEMANNTYSGSVSNNYSRNGIPSYRIELRLTDPLVNGSKRSEISVAKPEPAAGKRTYNFSILMPKGGSEDYELDPKGDEIIAQWHNTPDPGEEWTYPPLSLHTSRDGHYHLYRCWDEDPMSTEQKMDAEGKIVSYDLGSYLDDKGKWVDWTFDVKWGWLESQNPLIQIYKNGNKIFELKAQPNTTNDQIGVRMKLGIYKHQWAVKDNPSILTTRVVYYDNVSIK